ncbi:hypothetical protein [Nocardia thailandica]|uniref:hypothetical protein n=1 Tax=Nocardia thailandica TaxID=257275 RepID=UPI001FDFA979|nr:hypothetical protein [Nocardia thailandica]
MIEKAAFAVRSRRIVRDREEDLAVVRDHLFDEEPVALPDGVERLFAERRRYWGVLRDSGAMDAAEEADCIRREAEGR